MTHHLDRPLRQRMAGVYVAEATNLRRLSAEQRRVSAFHVAALAFMIGVIAGMLIGGLVTV
jgi:hypothetical protein